jgi:diguanylate cyclase (GGDEF)-like protein
MQSITALGFALVIAFMLFAIAVGYRATGAHQERLAELVRDAGVKTVLAYTMREAVRERIDALRAMLLQSDPFERDRIKMRFFSYAGKYTRARQALVEQATTPQEHEVVRQLDAIARQVAPPNNRAIEALFDYELDQHEVDAAVQEAVDLHLLLLKHLDDAVRSIHRATQEHISAAGSASRDGLLTQSALGIVAFALAILTATLVVLNTGHRNRRLTHQASHDDLTGLLNRSAFESALREVVEQSALAPDAHALLLIDLDRLKLVNDSCGHSAGDQLLRELGTLMSNNVRYSDLVARVGGDEFAVLLRRTEAMDATQVAEKLRRTVAGFSFQCQGHTFQVSASIGMVTFGAEPVGVADLVRAADACCYSAKEEGRNRVHQADVNAERVLRRSGEMRWINRINDALKDDRFVLFGQLIHPMQADRDDGRLSLELLLRMRDEDGLGLIPPGQFLPAAERYGIVPDIDRWVVQHSLRWLAGLGALAQQIRISINICGSAASDPQFHHFVREQIQATGVPPRSLCFEITESVAISDLSNAAALVEALGDLGCQFALDDFGSGLSSFSQLRHLAVDYLKIDGGFVHNIDRDPLNLAMVESINTIGKKLGKQTVAEFVENERIRAILEHIGVDYAQGFALHKPEPLSRIESRITRADTHNQSPRQAFVA